MYKIRSQINSGTLRQRRVVGVNQMMGVDSVMKCFYFLFSLCLNFQPVWPHSNPVISPRSAKGALRIKSKCSDETKDRVSSKIVRRGSNSVITRGSDTFWREVTI